MNNNLKDILSRLHKDTEQNKLLEYLNEQLSKEEQHAVETNINEDAFMSDAHDGLTEIEDRKQIEGMVSQLNAGLKKQLNKRTAQKKSKRKLPAQPWLYYTLVVLLILVVIAFVVIKRMHG